MIEQYRFKGRQETEWSDWTDRFEPDGRDNIEFPDDDDILEYQHRTVDRDHKQGDMLVSHDWGKCANGVVFAEIEDDRIATPGMRSHMLAYVEPQCYEVEEKLKLTIEEDPVKDAGYITKDSGARHEYGSGMVRDAQDGKPRFDLVIPEFDHTEVALFYALFLKQATREGRLHGADTTAIASLVDWYERPRRELALKVLAEIEHFEGTRTERPDYGDLLTTRWAALMGRGAEKYGDRNWEKSDGTDGALDRARGSALRHGMQWWNRQTDEDHAAAVCFNVGAVDYYQGRQA